MYVKGIKFKTVYKIMHIYGFLPKQFKVVTSTPNTLPISNDKTIPSFFTNWSVSSSRLNSRN